MIPSLREGKQAAIMGMALLVLGTVFFFSDHDVRYSFAEANVVQSVDMEDQYLEGTMSRRVAFVSLFVLSCLCLLVTKRRNGTAWDHPLPWAMLGFGILSIASVLWSIEPGLSIRRLAVFGIFCIAASTLASRFPADFLPACVLAITSLYLAVGVGVEITSGTFHPLSGDFRFAGTVHPNVQGVNCSLMAIAAAALAAHPTGKRTPFLAAVLAALVFLFLTKSRTSLFCLLVTLSAFILFESPKMWILAVLWVLAMCAGVFYFFLGDDLVSTVKAGLLMGRPAHDIGTFTGRTPIWEESLNYIGSRPLLGYGFSSFWTPRHIHLFSYAEGWSIPNAHSAYIDLLLALGLVGLLTYLLVLSLGIRRAHSSYKENRSSGNGFVWMMLFFSFLHGLTESGIVEFSSLDSFVLIWGLLLLSVRPADGEVRLAA